MAGVSVVSYRNSTSNHNLIDMLSIRPVVVSYRNSTSNHNGTVDVLPGRPVVSYRNSTSNHNTLLSKRTIDIVVSYRNSTSNHNKTDLVKMLLALYLIEILHQTTTLRRLLLRVSWLYLIEILHQTTTQSTVDRNTAACCILSKFYIKPQRSPRHIFRF